MVTSKPRVFQHSGTEYCTRPQHAAIKDKVQNQVAWGKGCPTLQSCLRKNADDFVANMRRESKSLVDKQDLGNSAKKHLTDSDRVKEPQFQGVISTETDKLRLPKTPETNGALTSHGPGSNSFYTAHITLKNL